MINAYWISLFKATILALCVISVVYIFLFSSYNVNARHGLQGLLQGRGDRTNSRSPVLQRGPGFEGDQVSIASPGSKFSENGPDGLSKTFMDLEMSLCLNKLVMKHRKAWKSQQCPDQGVVTIKQLGRLGNQIWEYACVWAFARRTGLKPYVPRCIRITLDQIFDSLTVSTLDEISHCPADVYMIDKSLDEWNYTHQSILLPKYGQLPDIVLPWIQDIVQEFTFKKKLKDKSQQILRLAAKNMTQHTFVGIHVRRTDFVGHLWKRYSLPLVNSTYFKVAMRYFDNKYENVTFVMVSDDPAWCVSKFGKKKNVFIASGKIPNSPAIDLAILASCNHSIIDYGSFGLWGAILAGGETVYFNVPNDSTTLMGKNLPNWHDLQV